MANIETLKTRIDNAKAKIEKKQNVIEGHARRIEKKKAEISKYAPNRSEARWLAFDIRSLEDDIVRGQKEIAEIKQNLAKYEAQLAVELERESVLINETPDSLKQMAKELVEHWDTWDKERREHLKAKYKELGYKEFMKKFSFADYEFRYKTDEQIHNANVRDARVLVLDLYDRVKDITGDITDWSGIYAQAGSHGLTVLNGIVIGKNGKAEIESILAGGYNIQRLHVRVLVKKYK